MSMNSNLNPQEVDEVAITAALEHRASVAVPVEFAARVVAALPPQRARRRAMPVGRSVAIAAAVLLTVALFALAPHSVPSFVNWEFDVELFLVAQLCGIAWLVGVKQGIDG